jgi:outer membrane protein OmpA-like peptidoglycan-associated protein
LQICRGDELTKERNMDLSNLGQPFAQGGLIDSISHFVGGQPDATRKTLNAALPATMYGIADAGSSELGARSLLDGLRSGQAPQLDIGDLGRTLSDPQAADKLVTSGRGFLERTLGSKLNGVVGALSSFGGGDRGVTSKLLALAAPLALGVIGRHASENKLDARGLSDFLSSQKSRIAALVPGPLRSLLGAGDTRAAGETQARAVAEAARPPSRPERSVEVGRIARPAAHAPGRSVWLWGLVVLAAVIGFGWLFERGRHARHARPPVPAQATKLSTSMKPVSAYLASGDSGPRRFAFDGLTFAIGDSQLSPAARQVARELAGELNMHPTATVRLEGRGDATGTANTSRELAQARSEAVKRALMEGGVAGERIETAVAAGAPSADARRVDVIIRGGAQQ